MPRRRDTPEDLNYSAAKEAYRDFGRLLYGLAPRGEGLDASRAERKKWKFGRRMLEHYYPKLRQDEEDVYREGSPDRALPVPRLTIEFEGQTGAGRLVYPDGSRRLNKMIAFGTRAELRDALAELINSRKVDPERTQVVVGGSAQPLLTLIDTL